jgi:hypothetical protein
MRGGSVASMSGEHHYEAVQGHGLRRNPLDAIYGEPRIGGIESGFKSQPALTYKWQIWAALPLAERPIAQTNPYYATSPNNVYISRVIFR